MVDTITPRVKRFCDWLENLPPMPPFRTLPEFRFFRNLTAAEIADAAAEMRRRAKPFADALIAQGEPRKAIVMQRDADGQFAIRFAEPADDRERAIELRFPSRVEAELYGRELTLTWGNVFGPLIDQVGRAA